MIAVADTSPICYLILIGEIGLLPKLFEEVLLPSAVVTELLHEDAPQTVRDWAADLPRWITVRDVRDGSAAGMEKLQAGERAAILAAESIEADVVVILDEKSARRVATERGIQITGTLGVLGQAADRELVDLASAIDRLTKTTFRYSAALLKAMIDRHR